MFEQILSDEKIKIISVDIFDTLVLRPVLKPADIFFLLDDYYRNNIDTGSSICFSTVRANAEQKLIKARGVRNISLGMIYSEISKELSLTEKQMEVMKEREAALEVDLSSRNDAVYDIIKNARNSEKKIILTSDMYLPCGIIKKILDKLQITYDELYVSIDFGKRKDDGTLYDEILRLENIQPCEMLHIGDNEQSDYLIPLNKGIIAYHYTPAFLPKKNNAVSSGTSSIILGYTFNEEECLKSKYNKKYTNFFDFGFYYLGPIALSTALYILQSKEIQENYSNVFFTSRDGYLPYTVYEYVRNILHKGIEGKYIYCGRKALSISDYDGDAFKFVESIYKNKIKTFNNSFEFAFKSVGISEFFKGGEATIAESINDIQKLETALKTRKKEAVDYFSKQFEHENRVLVYDTGYSGSVSDSLVKLTGKKVDKIYLWETRFDKDKSLKEQNNNTVFDKNNKTKTLVLVNDVVTVLPYNLLFEECFSSTEKSCTGYEHGKPVVDEGETINEDTIKSITTVQNGILEFVKCFCNKFKNYLSALTDVNVRSVFDNLSSHLYDAKDQSINLFSNVIYEDYMGKAHYNETLLNKLSLNYTANVFKGSLFLDSTFLKTPEKNKQGCDFNIGIHLHLYYAEMYPEFISLLADFPYPFDLHITVTNLLCKDIVISVFSKRLLPALNQTNVIITPNRGRDVAPWIIEMRDIHKRYDVFCHIHTKKSFHFSDFNRKWKDYLYNNLISPEAAIDIMKLFKEDSTIGIVYPPMIKDIFDIHFNNEHTPMQEEHIISKLLAKLNLPQVAARNEVLFSAGTMFWYRPEALEKLLCGTISYNDFPEEPVGTGGTLAHAIERLPSYIAGLKGFKTRLYLTNGTLVSEFYQRNYYDQMSGSQICPSQNVRQIINSRTYRYALKLADVIRRLFPKGSLRSALAGKLFRAAKRIVSIGKK
ncbi:hypothetical protein FACS1894190_07940 [Spirochaetia bacterium]|nr:hypothetical protein FACS1894190_07940 [Spirochaetia bacterium]